LVPAGAEFDDLATLTAHVAAAIRDWQRGRMPELPPIAATTPASIAKN
jgi:hypothetical protein